MHALICAGPTDPGHECAQRDKTLFLQKIAISFSRVNAATRLFQLGGCFGDRDAIATDANFAICFATAVASASASLPDRYAALFAFFSVRLGGSVQLT